MSERVNNPSKNRRHAIGSPAGNALRGAFACRWALSPPRSISSNCGARAATRCHCLEPGAGAARPWLRGYAAGYVKKNRELDHDRPLRAHPQPALSGIDAHRRRLCLALLSWPVALVLAVGFAVIYIPVIASRSVFCAPLFRSFDAYCRRVPRLIPRLTQARADTGRNRDRMPAASRWSLYLKHREYNAALGAALLYLSLLFLRPALQRLLHRLR